MLKYIFSLAFFCVISATLFAQTREELEKQRQNLKKEIEQTEELLNKNKAQTKENLYQLSLINNKVNLQNRVIDNINYDLRLLNNNIYSIQRDINKYDKLLDTLKQEYAKSMVYAYKNRSNYEFLNFIFSADNFNDAIKRLSYLKSYRSYREMQGQNIVRTQELRRQRIQDLGSSKKEKNSTLQVQSKEMQTLEDQKKEQDRVVTELKKQGKSINNQIAAKKKQMAKVSNAIAAAIRKAQEAAKKEALAKAAREERERKAALAKANANANEATKNNNAENNAPANTKSVAATTKVNAPAKKVESVLLNADNLALNSSFERNRHNLPWPVDKGYVLMHYGLNKLPSEGDIILACTTISADIGSPVKSIFDGTVISITQVEDTYVITIQHGKYFSSYYNVNSISVQKGEQVKTGQVIGKVAANLDGVGSIDFYMSNEKGEFDPESWLRHR
ncbi:MAG: peptidoglycan DD-metalloendopeptidase family protein [Bacteroidetes bacterium]|nr:peptidoglycan DD-metalloendopeptidase family protein [Bacteroidota bacterium]MBS1757022.1 peptidoglycan DD-metalloendopeptidase family protein [Bacteroidota bacterium]